MALNTPAQAQYSPNCERNGRRDHCALTFSRPSQAGWERITVVFADHSVFQLERDERRCLDKGAERLCPARLQTAGSQGRWLPATYKGRAYEGGYRHAYSGGGTQIVFSFLD
ncbi:MAG: hypothetical protein VKI83_09775 [Synechococcaceae cyanobacterium]|nr:hypothetical protein [Synechococcaceae cyanobacterium]